MALQLRSPCPIRPAGPAPAIWAPGLRVAVARHPLSQESGDLAVVIERTDGRLMAVVADVCGSGPPAARLAARVHAELVAWVGRGAGPGAALGELNQWLEGQDLLDRFVGMCCAEIDPDNGVGRLAVAGHLQPLIRRRGGPVVPVTAAAGPPLGVLSNQRYLERSLRLHPGDALVFVTDGIADAFGSAGDPLGEAGLGRALANAPGGVAGLCRAVFGAAARVGFKDDATIMAVALHDDF